MTERFIYPPLQRQASVFAQRQKRCVIGLVELRLGCLVFIAILAVVATYRPTAPFALILSALAFAAVLAAELYARHAEPEKRWYDSRALSESTKSLSWRYCMRAEPFALDGGVDEAFVDHLRKLHDDRKHLTLPSLTPSGDPLPKEMRELRLAPFETRKRQYKLARLDDQEVWYSQNSKTCTQKADRWSAGLVATSVIGILAAFLQLISIISFDLMGVMGAVTTAGIAWLQTQQYRSLAHEYSSAAVSLNHQRLDFDKSDEDNFAKIIGEIENNIAREHDVWQVARRKPQW